MQALTSPSIRRTMSSRAWYWEETIPMKIWPLKAWIQSSFSITSPIPSSGRWTTRHHMETQMTTCMGNTQTHMEIDIKAIWYHGDSHPYTQKHADTHVQTGEKMWKGLQAQSQEGTKKRKKEKKKIKPRMPISCNKPVAGGGQRKWAES